MDEEARDLIALVKNEEEFKEAFGEKWLNAYRQTVVMVERMSGCGVSTTSRFMVLAWTGFLANASHSGGKVGNELAADMAAALMMYIALVEKGILNPVDTTPKHKKN